MTQRTIWLLRLILATVATVMALVVGELILSARLQPESVPSVATTATPQPTPRPAQAAKSVYHNAPWIHRLPTAAIDMHAVVEAFSWDEPTQARVNSFGFRTPEFTFAHPPATFRVVVVGDSLTWGQGVAPEEMYSAVLERELTAILEPRGVTAEVIALGVCGSRLIDNLIRLEALGRQLDPDLVVVQFFPNDLEYLPSFPRGDVLAELGERSGLFEVVRKVRDRNSFWDQQEAWTDPSSIEWRLFMESVEALAAWRQAEKLPVVVLAFPPSDQRRNGGNFDEFSELQQFKEFLEPPKEVFRAAGLEVLDLVEPLREQAGRRFLCISESDGHPNPLAHDIAARAVAGLLRDRGWLPLSVDGVRPEGERWAAEAVLRQRAEKDWERYNADYESQRELFEELLALLPDEPWLVAQSAHLYQEMGRYEAACTQWRSLLELAAESVAPWYQVTRCEGDDNARDEAARRMLALVPDHAGAIEERLRIAERTGGEMCGLAMQLAEVARYPEQFTRAHEWFVAGGCEGS